MGRRTRWTIAGVLALSVGACTSLPYSDDVGFLVSAQADSPEFPVYVNGHLCTDLEGNPGLCSKRVKSTDDLTLSFDPQTYAYLMTLRCSQGVTPVAPLNSEAGKKQMVTIPASSFSSLREFICEGYVQPQDRPVPTSAMFSVHVIVYDASYTAREAIYPTSSNGKRYLVLGQYARTAWVYDQGKWTQHQQETTVQIQGDPAQVKAMSESYAERWNYYNMSDADSGVTP